MRSNFTRIIVTFIFLIGFGISNLQANSANESSPISNLLNDKLVTLKVTDMPLSKILDDITRQTGVGFAFDNENIDKHQKITVEVQDASINEVLNRLLTPINYSYEVVGSVVHINKNTNISEVKPQEQPKDGKFKFSGVVVDDNGRELIGATLIIKGTNDGTITDDKGVFTLMVNDGAEIEITYNGMKDLLLKADVKKPTIRVDMERDDMAVSDVVVTGIFKRKIDSFTGSYASYSGEDLKRIGGTSILQSLRTLDPAFLIIDSKLDGSNPNVLPEIELRGVSTIQGIGTEFGQDPNMPLFILDGVEVRLQDIVNLHQERVASITILKDAASTAIYGSRAANGVIVVETVVPKPGKLTVSYSGGLSIQMPDLSDYNLMNAAEKLEFERLAGVYDPNTALGESYTSSLTSYISYNEKLEEVQRGVDSYWLSEPLRVAVNHNHSLNIDGGDSAVRYAIGFTYTGNNGVMIGSQNNSIGANFTLSYRTEKFIFSNRFYTTISSQENEPVAFSEFSKQNPYFRKYKEDGTINEILDVDFYGDVTYNPMYLASFPNDIDDRDINFSNSFSVEWKILNELRANASLSLTYNTAEREEFKSPFHLDYAETVDLTQKGRYAYSIGKRFTYNGDIDVTYGKLINKVHQINAVAGWDFREYNNMSNGYSLTGFTSDTHSNPQYSAGFKEGTLPTYAYSISRSTSFYGNVHYGYDGRYLLDFTSRADATSVFGSEELFSYTWSVGVAWNVHNEKFVKDLNLFNLFKIRASMGNPGNQNFSAYLPYKTYTYLTSNANMFGQSAVISAIGNPNLEWQRTIDKNIGFDMGILNNRLRITFDYYNKKTEPQLISLPLPISSGATSINSNAGGLLSWGYNGTINATVIQTRKLVWNVSATFGIDRSEYFGIAEYLEDINSTAENAVGDSFEGDQTLLKSIKDTDVFKRFYDGYSPNALFGVQSLGIDPATGYELYMGLDGLPTYTYDYSNEFYVGNSRPTYQGVVGTSLQIGNFDVTANFRYSVGAMVFASALYQKVEALTQPDLLFNQDKRALYDRWQFPGDDANFSAITNIDISNTTSPVSTRFLIKENTFSMESLSVGYRFDGEKLAKYGFNSLTARINTNNLFRISTLKEERGIDYPFARIVSATISASF